MAKIIGALLDLLALNSEVFPVLFQAAGDDDDDDLDLFGDETEEDKKAAEEREKAKKGSSKKKESKLPWSAFYFTPKPRSCSCLTQLKTYVGK